MTAQHAVEQASTTAREYARKAVSDLKDILGIDSKSDSTVQAQLAPFAPVLAAMIAAAAQDFHTAVMSGAVDGLPVRPPSET